MSVSICGITFQSATEASSIAAKDDDRLPNVALEASTHCSTFYFD